MERLQGLRMNGGYVLLHWRPNGVPSSLSCVLDPLFIWRMHMRFGCDCPYMEHMAANAWLLKQENCNLQYVTCTTLRTSFLTTNTHTHTYVLKHFFFKKKVTTKILFTHMAKKNIILKYFKKLTYQNFICIYDIKIFILKHFKKINLSKFYLCT